MPRIPTFTKQFRTISHLTLLLTLTLTDPRYVKTLYGEKYGCAKLFHWHTQQPSQANTHQNKILQKDLDLLCDWEAK